MRRFALHRRTVTGLHWGGIGLAGLFTLLPGRIMNEVVFGGIGLDLPAGSWILSLAAGILLAVWLGFRARRQAASR